MDDIMKDALGILQHVIVQPANRGVIWPKRGPQRCWLVRICGTCATCVRRNATIVPPLDMCSVESTFKKLELDWMSVVPSASLCKEKPTIVDRYADRGSCVRKDGSTVVDMSTHIRVLMMLNWYFTEVNRQQYCVVVLSILLCFWETLSSLVEDIHRSEMFKHRWLFSTVGLDRMTFWGLLKLEIECRLLGQRMIHPTVLSLVNVSASRRMSLAVKTRISGFENLMAVVQVLGF